MRDIGAGVLPRRSIESFPQMYADKSADLRRFAYLGVESAPPIS